MVHDKKEELKKMKLKHEKRSLKNYNEKKRIDDINSPNLIGYYKSSYNNIKEYYVKIQSVIERLAKLRGPNNMKDIIMQRKRADKLYIEEYGKLVMFEEHDKINN